MRCDNCQEREAEINLTTIEGGEMATHHLCSQCAASKGLGSVSSQKPPLADFLGEMGETPETPALSGSAEGCPYCGTTPRDFRNSGRLGCSQCYAHFSPQLRGLLRRVHGSTQHVGKVYVSHADESDRAEERLTTLQRRLERAVEIEDFEAAARLRDQIHEMETVE